MDEPGNHTGQSNRMRSEKQGTTVKRTIEERQIEPSETTTVHLEISLTNESSFLTLHESFSPTVGDVELVSLPSAGDEWESAGTTEALSVFYDADGAPGLKAGSQIELSYEVTVPDDPGHYGIAGELGLIEGGKPETEVWIPIEDDTFQAGEGVEPYTNANRIVDTPGLRDAINDWRMDDISTSLLRDVIDAWRTGEPIN